MVSDCQFDIGIPFNNRRAKIFVTVCHNEVLLMAKIVKSLPVMSTEIWNGFLGIKDLVELDLEIMKPSLEYLGPIFVWRAPVCRHVQTWGVIFLFWWMDHEKDVDMKQTLKVGPAIVGLQQGGESCRMEGRGNEL